jgi:hypothetical protein
MLASPEFIEIIVRINRNDLFGKFKQGDHIARGYADLGYEEFIALGPTKIVSLYSGTQSELPPEHLRFFYTLPNTEQMLDVISRQNFDICSALYHDQRIWRLSAKHINTKQEITADHREFNCALASILELSLKVTNDL